MPSMSLSPATLAVLLSRSSIETRRVVTPPGIELALGIKHLETHAISASPRALLNLFLLLPFIPLFLADAFLGASGFAPLRLLLLGRIALLDVSRLMRLHFLLTLTLTFLIIPLIGNLRLVPLLRRKLLLGSLRLGLLLRRKLLLGSLRLGLLLRRKLPLGSLRLTLLLRLIDGLLTPRSLLLYPLPPLPLLENSSLDSYLPRL